MLSDVVLSIRSAFSLSWKQDLGAVTVTFAPFVCIPSPQIGRLPKYGMGLTNKKTLQIVRPIKNCSVRGSWIAVASRCWRIKQLAHRSPVLLPVDWVFLGCSVLCT